MTLPHIIAIWCLHLSVFTAGTAGPPHATRRGAGRSTSRSCRLRVPRFDFAGTPANIAAASASSAAFVTVTDGLPARDFLPVPRHARQEVILWPWHLGHNVLCGICSLPSFQSRPIRITEIVVSSSFYRRWPNSPVCRPSLIHLSVLAAIHPPTTRRQGNETPSFSMTANSRAPTFGAVDIGFQSTKNYLSLASFALI